MSAPVFLVPDGLLTATAAGSTVRLDGPEGRHAVTVKRVRAGERVDLTDGAGHLAECVVSGVGKDTLSCTVEKMHLVCAPVPAVTVVQALVKGDRGELAVELMTEAGVDAIVPWAASRSIARWDGDRAARGLARWTATAREASKQCRRPWAARIEPIASTADVAQLIAGADLAVVLHEGASRPISELAMPAVGSVVIVVGPEGGISDEELSVFEAEPVRLGPEVVRTSTAGALAAGVLLSRSSRWQHVGARA